MKRLSKKMITKYMAELIGILMGDGYIYNRNGKYQIGFVGSPKTDREYFGKVKELIFRVWGKEGKIKERERGLRIVINSKEIVYFLTTILKIPAGEGKCEKISIPEVILRD